MLFNPFSLMPHPCIALDLGTANTRVYSTALGEMTEMPSCIFLAPQHANNIADEYLQYTNTNLRANPLRGGVIVDLNNTVKLLKPLIKKSRSLFQAPAALASAPTDSTEAERDLLRKALNIAGASHVSVIPEVLAAAHGAGMDTSLSTAQLLIDLGDGVTDLAVFRDGQMIFCSSIRTACSDLHRAIRSAVVAKHKIMLLDQDIERLTDEALSFLADKAGPCDSFEMQGIDIIKRRKVNCFIDRGHAADAITPVVHKITKMIETSLARLPEDVYDSIIESGILLTGGGACIQGFDELIKLRTNMDVRVASDPIHAVIKGEIETLNYWKEKHNWWDKISWPHNQAIAKVFR